MHALSLKPSETPIALSTVIAISFSQIPYATEIRSIFVPFQSQASLQSISNLDYAAFLPPNEDSFNPPATAQLVRNSLIVTSPVVKGPIHTAAKHRKRSVSTFACSRSPGLLHSKARRVVEAVRWMSHRCLRARSHPVASSLPPVPVIWASSTADPQLLEDYAQVVLTSHRCID